MESRLVRRATDRRVPLPTMPGVPIEPPPFYEFPFYTRQLPPLRRASKNATLGVPPDEMKPRKKSNVSPYRDLDDLRVALPLTANKCADFHEAPVHKNAQKHSSRETKKRGRGGGQTASLRCHSTEKKGAFVYVGVCVYVCVRVCMCTAAVLTSAMALLTPVFFCTAKLKLKTKEPRFRVQLVLVFRVVRAATDDVSIRHK
jgi:hypothetical protein